MIEHKLKAAFWYENLNFIVFVDGGPDDGIYVAENSS